MVTFEEMVEKARRVHGDRYEYVASSFTGMHKPVCIICKEHGEFTQNVHNHITGKQGCPICANKYKRIPNKKSYEQVLSEIKELYGDKYEIKCDDYQNNKSRIEVTCNTCGFVFNTTINSLLCGHGCKKCASEQLKLKHVPTKSIIEHFKSIHGDMFDYSLMTKEQYRENDKVEIICKKHGPFTAEIRRHYSSVCCRKCVNENVILTNIVRDKEDALAELKTLCGENIRCVNPDDYKRTNTPLTFECKICGHIFNRSLNRMQCVNTCPECNKAITSLKRTKSTEKFIEDCKSVHGDKYDYSGTIYKGSTKKVSVKCNDCGRTFSIEANSHLSGHGCPYHLLNKSKIECEILEYVHSIYDGEVTNNNRSILANNHELDIYIPDKSVAIELDGLFWHSEACKEKEYHLNKTQECASLGINLIHIFEDEWVYNKDMVKKHIKEAIGIGTNIDGRDITTSECYQIKAQQFYSSQHINYIPDKQHTHYCANYNGETVFMATFDGNKLVMYCYKEGYFGRGVLDVIVKAYKHNKLIDSITYEHDDRTGIFQENNFEKCEFIEPKFYYIKGDKRYTEEIKDSYKIYDSGHTIFIHKKI